MFVLFIVSSLVSVGHAGSPASLVVESEGPVTITRLEGRDSTPVCTAPCTAELPADERLRLRFGGDGVPPTLKTVRLEEGEQRTVFVKPGKKGPRVAGAILTGLGLVAITTGSVLNTAAGPQGGSGLVLPAAGIGVTLVGLPLTLAGKTKIKRR